MADDRMHDDSADDDRTFEERAAREFESEVPPAITFPPEVGTRDAADDPERGEYVGAVRAGLTIVPEVTVEPGASEESPSLERLEGDSLGEKSVAEPASPNDEGSHGSSGQD